MKNQKRGRSAVIPLPDDVVVEILSRLPAHDVLKFRRVCRRWRDLISTQYFAEMHLKACISPMILVDERGRNDRFRLLLLDKWEPARERITIRKVRHGLPSSFRFTFSRDGLVVLTGCNVNVPKYIIFNPIFGDNKVTILNHPADPEFDICGMFFNTFIKEYCVLWASFEGGNVQFKMLTLGAQQCLRDLRQPNFTIQKPRYPPVVIDDAAVYWLCDIYDCFRCESLSCEERIMGFDTKTEEFTLMSHPGPAKDCHLSGHLNIHILKMGGCLSFVQMTIERSFIVNIWTLKDSATRLWVKTHSVPFNMDQFSTSGIRMWNAEWVGVIAVENGELLLRHLNERICACNLKLGTVRKIGRKYDPESDISLYVPSFVSLRNGEVLNLDMKSKGNLCDKKSK